MLRFDARQRYDTVRTILTHLFPEDSQTVLDIGGGTGEALCLPEDWRLVSVDVRMAPCTDFVCGSADRLPFGDCSFDIATCLDTLEHLPTDRRKESLTEMSRVARKAVLVTAPFNSEDVRAAENTVNDLHSQTTGKPHPWLVEHLATSLPDLRETCDLLESAGWHVVTMPCGYLPLWLMLMLVDQMLENLEEGTDIAEGIDRIYQREIYPNDLCEPAYRTVVVATKESTPSPDFLFQPDNPRLARGMCKVLSLIISALSLPIDETVQEDESSSATLQRYSEHLEHAVETWEVAYGEALALAEQGHRRMAELERRRSFRLYRWLMRLLGRHI